MIPEGAERREKGPSHAAEKLPPSRFVTGHDFKACPERSRRMPIKPIKSVGFSPCGAPSEPFSSAIKPFSAACLALEGRLNSTAFNPGFGRNCLFPRHAFIYPANVSWVTWEQRDQIGRASCRERV